MIASQFFKYLPDYLSPEDKELIKRAYVFAYNKHKGQYRKNEEPYIIHPTAVAKILIDIHADAASICAGLLHDVVEDTSASEDEVRELFGDDIAELVMAVTKLENLNYSSKEDHQAENFRKMFFAMAKDMRVVFIKLADRLHNMRTLGHMKPEKQKEIARETIDIFAPLANRLGIWNIKAELEDLSFRYLHPDEYFDMLAKLNIEKEKTDELISEFISKITTELHKAHIKAEVKGRAKHLYSIYAKMRKHGKDIADIFDKLAIRVVVEDKKDCYAVLGLAHSIFKPIPDRFKDYIAMPKNNLYQSLHTGVIFNGFPFEIQIRTKEMHNIAEYGIAAHWQYKEQGKKADHKINWLRQMLENQKDISDAKEFLTSVKLDLFADEVFVFTPRGDLISLPIHSTPLDFAYRIHSDIGNHCSGAKVNNRMVPINSKLHTGDIVEIITNKNAHPTRDWLNYEIAGSTRNRIRQWLKKTYRAQYIADGEKVYGQVLIRLHLEDDTDLQTRTLHKFHMSNMENFYEALGYGDITADNLESKLRHISDKKQHEHHHEEAHPKAAPHKPATPSSVISQVSNMLMHFPKCCSAIPGDPIKGVVTKGRGISVHNIDCQYLLKADPNRLIDISWGQESRNPVYPVSLSVEMLDRVGILRDIVTIIADTKTNIRDAKVKTKSNTAVAYINITMDVSGVEHLNSIINKIKKLPDVINIRRQRAVSKV